MDIVSNVFYLHIQRKHTVLTVETLLFTRVCLTLIYEIYLFKIFEKKKLRVIWVPVATFLEQSQNVLEMNKASVCGEQVGTVSLMKEDRGWWRFIVALNKTKSLDNC